MILNSFKIFLEFFQKDCPTNFLASFHLYALLLGSFPLSAALRSYHLPLLWSLRLNGPFDEFYFKSWITGSAEKIAERTS